ncbi:hypothetical protein SAMN04488595_103144 [Ralstonia sp. 25mfcol4.1]|nr:hypothetical protein SAMN04488595_103144 [Ralstonia sp. 25mfcol4.1]
MNRTLYIALAALLAVLGIAGAGAWLTSQYRAAQQRATAAETLVASLRAQLDSTDVGVVEVIRYVDRVKTIRLKGNTIIKEVPRYVTVEADAAWCACWLCPPAQRRRSRCNARSASRRS